MQKICDTICIYKKTETLSGKNTRRFLFVYGDFIGVNRKLSTYTDVVSMGIRIPRGLFAHTVIPIKTERIPVIKTDKTERITVNFFKTNTLLLITYFIIIQDKLHHNIISLSEIF